MSKEVATGSKQRSFKKIFRNVFSLVAVVVSVFLLNTTVKEWSKVFNSKRQLSTAQEELQELDIETEKLQGLKQKLSDPNYVQNYARGKHLMSKSDEQVFTLPKAKE